MNVIGFDIGGANTKAADGNGRCITRPFAIWKDPQQLPRILLELLAEFDRADRIAVTMTAELADCFRTKREGVLAILASVRAAAGDRPVVVWQTGAEFLSIDDARDFPELVAAANWHALATWAGRIAPSDHALLIDIGSTTTDIIPLSNGLPDAAGLTDCERLGSGELVYSGVRRTPLCAIAHSVPYQSGYCPLAAEWFATTRDVYLTLGDLPEAPDDCDTANNRPATRTDALDRLARMLCLDRSEFSETDARDVATFLAAVHQQRIVGAIDQVLRRIGQSTGPATRVANLDETPNIAKRALCSSVVIAGSGEFLAERIVGQHRWLADVPVTSLRHTLGAETAAAACAFAVAKLAIER